MRVSSSLLIHLPYRPDVRRLQRPTRTRRRTVPVRNLQQAQQGVLPPHLPIHGSLCRGASPQGLRSANGCSLARNDMESKITSNRHPRSDLSSFSSKQWFDENGERTGGSVGTRYAVAGLMRRFGRLRIHNATRRTTQDERRTTGTRSGTGLFSLVRAWTNDN